MKKAEASSNYKGTKAVIFDMDGLMIDSEPFHAKAYDTVLKKFGYGLTQEENSKRYVGISDLDASRDMVKRFNLPITPEELSSQKQQAYKVHLKEIKPNPGLMDLLRHLKYSGIKTAIASSSTIKEISSVVKTLGISPLINSITSAQEVENGKPAPDVFLLAAKKLKVAPALCLVLEDAPSGIAAAKAAGMFRFAIPSPETKDKDFSDANKVLENLSEVFSLIKPSSNK